ncbi:MAG: von Willebrand factor type [Bacteroidetes bacterium]|nr:von Willebrand factor type [Bacteroidota bacterium]
MSDFRPVDRRPVNVAVVIDRSGSMADARKIDYARAALLTVIDELRSNDIFSLIMYDNEVDVLRPAKRVGSDKRYIRELVDQIYPRGSTNLGGGMIEGFHQVGRNAAIDYVNRVILISDGLANQGITDPRELRRIAGNNIAKGISLTTMGVGLEYNENLMVGLSESGGGNYYFIESPNGLAGMLQRELNCLASVIAQNAYIELTLGRGVRVNDVIGCENRSEGSKHIIHLGDLYSNERREVTVELDIPEGTGSLIVASGTVKFERGEVRVGRIEPFSVTVQYTRELALIDKKRDLDSQAKADVALSTRTVEKAMKALDEGRREEAEQTLSEAKAVLQASPAAAMSGAGATAINEQAAKLEGYSDIMKDKSNDSRATKKSIQYDNYKTQKKK